MPCPQFIAMWNGSLFFMVYVVWQSSLMLKLVCTSSRDNSVMPISLRLHILHQLALLVCHAITTTLVVHV